jgi:hypothetical protein
MINFTRIGAIALLGFTLMACGEAEEEPTGVIPQGHLDAMDKARGVESTLQDAEQKKLEEIDDI